MAAPADLEQAAFICTGKDFVDQRDSFCNHKAINSVKASSQQVTTVSLWSLTSVIYYAQDPEPQVIFDIVYMRNIQKYRNICLYFWKEAPLIANYPEIICLKKSVFRNCYSK